VPPTAQSVHHAVEVDAVGEIATGLALNPDLERRRCIAGAAPLGDKGLEQAEHGFLSVTLLRSGMLRRGIDCAISGRPPAMSDSPAIAPVVDRKGSV
jgi:hypothetical protein